MKSKWTIKRICEIGTVVGGSTPSTKRPDFYDGDIPWITPKDLSGYDERFISKGERNITKKGFDSCSTQMLPKGTVLFSSRAPIGYVAIASNELCTNQGFKSVIPNKDTDSEFLYYLLFFNRDRIANLGNGTTFREVSGSVMKSVEVSVPSKEIQNKIASILSSYDEKIENNNSIISKLFELIEALYQENILNKVCDKKIPDGWSIVPLSKVLSVNKRGLSPTYDKTGIPVINQRCIRKNIIIEEAIQYHDVNVKYDRECEYKPYDVLINSMGVGTLGRVSQVGILKNKMLIHSCVTVLRANNLYNQFILGAHMRHIQKEIEAMGEGTTGQTSLSNKELGKKTIPLPPKDVQEKYGMMFQDCLDLISDRLLENETLRNTRNALIKKIFSEQLTFEEE